MRDTKMGRFGTDAPADVPNADRRRIRDAIDRLAWRAHRLRAMGPAEILHRFGEARRRRRWRDRLATWPDIADAPSGALPRWPMLRGRLATASELPSVRESATAAASGRLAFLGYDWPQVTFGDADSSARFWLHDPVSRRAWPGCGTPGFAVDVRSTGDDGSSTFGDVKFVWEPSRLQMLHPLAAASAAGDHAAHDLALTILKSWATANPPYDGVNWVSGIEAALRIVSVALVVAAAPRGAFAGDDRLFLRRFVAAHAELLTAFPSLHSSANNHRVAEGLGLFLAGLLLPDLGAHWTAEGRAILEVEADRQIFPDGGGGEQSPTYQAFTVEMLALAVLFGLESGRPLAGSVADRLVAAAGFLGGLMDDVGHVPAIGDNDEGRVTGQPPDREPRYVAGVVAAVAGLTERPDIMPPAVDPHLRAKLFAADFMPMPATVGRQTFHEAGYTVARTKVRQGTATLVFDHGPLGYLSLAAHGHADALAVWLSIGGQPVFIDTGTYLYFGGGARRRRQRESPAHNTLCLDGLSQSVAASGFSWASRATSGHVIEDDGSIRAWHDGYRRRRGVRHERTLSFVDDGFVLTDRLIGRGGPHRCEIGFLLPGELAVTQRGGLVHIGTEGETLCRLTPPAGFAVSVQDDGGEATYSPRFGTLLPGQRIRFTGDMGAASARTRITI